MYVFDFENCLKYGSFFLYPLCVRKYDKRDKLHPLDFGKCRQWDNLHPGYVSKCDKEGNLRPS